jgi:hypothetical protein
MNRFVSKSAHLLRRSTYVRAPASIGATRALNVHEYVRLRDILLHKLLHIYIDLTHDLALAFHHTYVLYSRVY